MQKVTPMGPRQGPAHKMPRTQHPAAPRPTKADLGRVGAAFGPKPPVEEDRAPGGAANHDLLTKLYIDVMHAAVRRSDAWGAWAMMGESLRGIGLLAIVGAPAGLPCAAVMDAARMSRRWWRALR